MKVERAVEIPGYVLGEQLGAGGFGQVFRAHHALMGRDVAIKVLHPAVSADPEAVARFIAEARAVARISHPAIVEIFEFGTLPDGRQFCVMELLRGRTLRELLHERSRLLLDEALPILRRVAEAVDAAHRAGVAHRDLKPDNIFVGAEGVKLIDFGIAKLADDSMAPVTATGSVFGTPLYMSPEQCRGKSDTRTDLYSFGAMAFHVLTGEPPFSGTGLELALMHLNDLPPRASTIHAELPAHVDATLDALLAKDPAQRPSPLVDVVDALAGAKPLAIARQPIGTDATVRSDRLAVAATQHAAPPRRPRWPWLVAVLGLAGLGAAIFAVWPRGAVPVSDCAAGADRVHDAWDAKRRQTLTARFASVQRPDVQVTQRLLIHDLDGFSTTWARQWDAACTATDRDSEPLIYAQRRNCLDRALIDLRAVADSVRDVDPVNYALSWNGAPFAWMTQLADCERVETLRAMPAAPPRERTADVAALIARIHIARNRAREILNGFLAGSIDQPLAELADVTSKLDAIGAATAAESSMIHAHYLRFLSTRDAARAKDARASLDRALALGRKYRYDRILVLDYFLELGLERDAGASIQTLRATLASLQDAHERAGRPTPSQGSVIENERAEIAIIDGDFAAASAELETNPGDLETDVFQVAEIDNASRRAGVLGHLGRTELAISVMRAAVANRISTWGAEHMWVAFARAALADTMARFGDARAALDENTEARAIATQIGLPPTATAAMELSAMVLADRLGSIAERDAAIARWRSGVTLAPDADGWLGLAAYADSHGRAALATAIRARSTSPVAPLMEALAASYLADDRRALALASAVKLTDDDMRATIVSIRARADARAGRTAAVEAYLAAEAPRYANPDALDAADWMASDAQVLLMLHRWAAARTLFERALRVSPDIARRGDNNMVLIESGWGRALLESGDPTAARPHLERALFAIEVPNETVVNQIINVDSSALPDASFDLARALVATNGDKIRAKALAQRAIDNYGPFRTADRDVAAAWLAAQH